MNLPKIILSLLFIFLTQAEILQQKENQELAAQNEILFKHLKQTHNLTDEQIIKIKAIFTQSSYISQGNPIITKHPVTEEKCKAMLQENYISYENPRFEKICGNKYMAPLYDPETKVEEEASVCIDQFEFPNIPCSYPVVWVRANEAVILCEILGKRMCDAHEWEGACNGNLLEPDYQFDLATEKDPNTAIKLMRQFHDKKWGKNKKWGYGNKYRKGACATGSYKNEKCQGGDWSRCGSNTYPSGYFPKCKSALEVYDMHGNAAEHMNLPLAESQMSSKGSKQLGYTEMKGSWFVFDTYYAHEDWCRWRAPFWHGSKVMDKNSHHNYHLGFRCCKTINPQKKEQGGGFPALYQLLPYFFTRCRQN
ncbi:MAG: hypothetical protein A2Y62_15795 [Candidatus Fischerbacteria bacterium RBG_13_37_8]|uniref:Sulfatase-modifying factor enzyme-like domain-containing protein n=1 Tax=Candidatus Fischerbacteria bacterium RBG_13_37_8 TaxID=1817863 RepID=A0A1F5VVK1_9BACT|nr:MAG: hypothetical protein A2Y62_15795 [Candidatus Fischerbacteria bacterium RBG_13_37_8]